MRFFATSDQLPGFHLHVITGTHGAILGMDYPEAHRQGLLGFAIERGEVLPDGSERRVFLTGLKTFEVVRRRLDIPPGTAMSSYGSPFQAFLWQDFTVRPGRAYTYRVLAVKGKPEALEYPHSVSVKVETHDQGIRVSKKGEASLVRAKKQQHLIFFNRGIQSSQAYARKYGTVKPSMLSGDQRDEAFQWLSRGLLEGVQAFIRQAKSKKDALRAAIYEFELDKLLTQFEAAAKAGADVQVVVHAKAGDTTDKHNRQHIRETLMPKGKLPKGLVIHYRKKTGKLMHNKFIVRGTLGKTGEFMPVEVLSGSTNMTQSGVYGHSNVAHIVADADVAAAFLTYWQDLRRDKPKDTLQLATAKLNPGEVDELLAEPGTYPIFSPEKGRKRLDSYWKLCDEADAPFFLTTPFGFDKKLEDYLATPERHLRYAILNRNEKDMQLLRRDSGNRIAVGSVLPQSSSSALENWLHEISMGVSGSIVASIHTKYLLIDPLGENPVVLSGSANFSEASISQNDENMLLVVGDAHTAEIYLTEFMRLFTHYMFRDFATQKLPKKNGAGPATEAKALDKLKQDLVPDSSWTDDYYNKTALHPKYRERLYFSQRPRGK